MATERNVVDFKIHNLTEEQFQELKAQGKIDPNAVYCTPDMTKERLYALETKTTSLEENKQDKGDYATNTALSQGLSQKQDKGDYATNTALSEGLAQKQDIATAVNYDNITNCITEIPQDIKLELANGVLTLKAGSKVYVPNGAGVFDVMVTPNDVAAGFTSETQQFMLFYNLTNIGIWYANLNEQRSGATNPSDLYGFFYNTSDNKVYYLRRTTTPDNETFSLPIAIITVNNGKVISIDQVFNGFGYIGSTVFALPGVKGLIPDGRNEDGSLKNLEVAVSSVQIFTAIGYGYGLAYGLYSNGKISARNNACYAEGSKPTWFDGGLYGTWFETESNKMLYTEDAGASWAQTHIVAFGSMYMTSVGRLDYLKTKTAFRAVDYNDWETLKNTITIAAPAGIVSAFAGKTAPSGWLKCDGSAISRTTYAALFASIGTLYGAGDGSTTFNLPNLIDGRVPFGMTSNYVGQSTEGVLPNITGTAAVYWTQREATGAFFVDTAHKNSEGNDPHGHNNLGFDASRSNSMYGGGWFEGRKVVPASVGMSYCIKY